MVKKLAAVGLLAALAMVPAVPAAGAAPVAHGPVTLEILMHYEYPGHGPFTADGVVCGSGYAQDAGLDVPVRGAQPPGSHTSVLLKEQKVFTCDDSADTFTLEFVTVLKWDRGGTLGEWKVVDGTGAYTDLRGNGTFKVQWLGDPNLEVWVGHMMLP